MGPTGWCTWAESRFPWTAFLGPRGKGSQKKGVHIKQGPPRPYSELPNASTHSERVENGTSLLSFDWVKPWQEQGTGNPALPTGERTVKLGEELEPAVTAVRHRQGWGQPDTPPAGRHSIQAQAWRWRGLGQLELRVRQRQGKGVPGRVRGESHQLRGTGAQSARSARSDGES